MEEVYSRRLGFDFEREGSLHSFHDLIDDKLCGN